MIRFYLNKCLKIIMINFTILLNNIYIKGCPGHIGKRGKDWRKCDIFIDLPRDDSKYKKIIDFIKNPENHKENNEETATEHISYKPLNIDIDIEITEEEIKNIIDKEINDIKNRTIHFENKEEETDKKKEEVDKKKNNKKTFIRVGLDEDKLYSKLGNLRFLYIFENDEIIPVKCGTFFFDDYYDTINKRNIYKKTYIDLWYDKYFKKEVYSFEKLKEFWKEYKPDYLYCEKYKYPVFLFKKDEKNKQLFKKEEEKHKNCSGSF